MKNIHYSVLAAAFAVPLLAIIMLNSGHFSYTLDDAYIHLALSEGIGNLHYGTNPGEISSPSSSILWPLLLAPLSHLPIHHYLPLLLNIVFVFLIAGVLHALIRKYLKLSSNSAFTVCFIVIVLTNQIGLAFTGIQPDRGHLPDRSIYEGQGYLGCRSLGIRPPGENISSLVGNRFLERIISRRACLVSR